MLKVRVGLSAIVGTIFIWTNVQHVTCFRFVWDWCGLHHTVWGTWTKILVTKCFTWSYAIFRWKDIKLKSFLEYHFLCRWAASKQKNCLRNFHLENALALYRIIFDWWKKFRAGSYQAVVQSPQAVLLNTLLQILVNLLIWNNQLKPTPWWRSTCLLVYSKNKQIAYYINIIIVSYY